MNQSALFKLISQVSQKTSLEVYVVGGFVRDEFLGITDKKDIDFVVLGSGLAFAKAFDEAVKQTGSLIEFAEFDTARYVFSHEDEPGKTIIDLEIEFAGA